MKDDLSVLTKKEASVELKKNIIKKWQKAFSLSESVGKIQESVNLDKVGKRRLFGGVQNFESYSLWPFPTK